MHAWALAGRPDSALVGNMSPYERINAYRGSAQWSPWRRRFSAALPWVFVVGVAAGTMLPVRHWVHGWFRCADARADSQAARDAEIIWKRAGNRGRAPPRRCDPHHRWRHVRGAGASVARASISTTRVRLRGIDAPELKASCPQELQMAEAATRCVARHCSARAEVNDLQYRAGQICRPRRCRRRDQAHRRMFRRRCSLPVTRAATAAAIAAAGARTQAIAAQMKSRAVARLLYSIWMRDQRVTITVVPTETR